MIMQKKLKYSELTVQQTFTNFNWAKTWMLFHHFVNTVMKTFGCFNGKHYNQH